MDEALGRRGSRDRILGYITTFPTSTRSHANLGSAQDTPRPTSLSQIHAGSLQTRDLAAHPDLTDLFASSVPPISMRTALRPLHASPAATKLARGARRSQAVSPVWELGLARSLSCAGVDDVSRRTFCPSEGGWGENDAVGRKRGMGADRYIRRA